MSVNVPSHYTLQFSSNVELLLQQQGSKLGGTVMTGSHTGEGASPVDQIDSVEANDVSTRFADMPRTDARLDRRWVYPIDSDINQMVDSFDKLRIVTDLQGAYTKNAVNALGRKQDRRILEAMFGTAKTGKRGDTSTSFTAGNEIDVAVGGANSRINVAKLIAVRELMEANFIDFDHEEVFVGVTAKDNAALLKEVQIISSDFNGGDKPVLKDGKVTSFLGFKFVHCELIESVLAGTNEVTLPVWAKSGMYLGTWGEIATDVSQRKDIQSLPWQVYAKMTKGATRLDEEKVFAIESYRA
jgi:hypothetical protein